MFPTGMAGSALLVLRVLVAATLVANANEHGVSMTAVTMYSLLAVPTICLCLGLFTPYSSACCCVVQLYWWNSGSLHFDRSIVAAVISSVLAALGPGAYSIDARIFGRRLLTLPRRE